MSLLRDQWNLILDIIFVVFLSPTAKGEAFLLNKTVLRAQNELPKTHSNYSYPTPILEKVLIRRFVRQQVVRERDYRWENHPILAFGVPNFLSYAAHYCKYETENGKMEVVSVGSGKGNIENEFIERYSGLFGKKTQHYAG